MDTTPRHATTDEQDPNAEPEMSEVIEGPIGSARIVNPSETETPNPDLDGFPVIDVDEAPAG